MAQIKIKGTFYEVRHTISSLMEFAKMTGKEVEEMRGIVDMITFIYCTLKGANKETFKFSFDEFVEIMDNDPGIFDQFNDVNTSGPVQKKVKSKAKS